MVQLWGTDKAESSIEAGPPPSASDDQPPDDRPPDGGYGWTCVLAVFFINAHTWGLNGAFGIFLAYYLEANTFPGTSSLEYALVGGLSVSQALVIGPIANIMTRRFGIHATLLLGTVIESAALVGASFATTIWHLFLTQGILFGWGMGLLFTGSVGVPAQWFSSRRSLANGLSTAGSGIGGLIWSIATNLMITKLGLPWVFRILAILTFVVNLISSLMLRDRSKSIGSKHLAFDYRLFARVEFVLLLAWGTFSMIGYTILQFSLPNYAQSEGLSASQASIVAAILSLGQAIGRPLIGYFSDSFGRTNMAGLMTFVSGVLSFVLWTFCKTYGSLIACALLLGLVFGTFWSTVTPVAAEVMGMKELPSVLAIVWVLLAFPATASEPIAMALNNINGRYLETQMVTGSMYLAAAIFMWALRAWKYNNRRMHEEQEQDFHVTLSEPEESVQSSRKLESAQGLFWGLIVLQKL